MIPWWNSSGDAPVSPPLGNGVTGPFFSGSLIYARTIAQIRIRPAPVVISDAARRSNKDDHNTHHVVRSSLFNGDRFGEVAWLVDVFPQECRDMIGDQLHRDSQP